MKLDKIILLSIVLVVLLSLGAVSASENNAAEDNSLSAVDYEDISSNDDSIQDNATGSAEILSSENGIEDSNGGDYAGNTLGSSDENEVLKENTEIIVTPEYMKDEVDEEGIAYFMDEPVDIKLEGEFIGEEFGEGLIYLYFEEFDEDSVINIDASGAIFKNIVLKIESYSPVYLNDLTMIVDENNLYDPLGSLLYVTGDGDYSSCFINNLKMTVNTNKFSGIIGDFDSTHQTNIKNSQFDINIQTGTVYLFDFSSDERVSVTNNIFNLNVSAYNDRQYSNTALLECAVDDNDESAMEISNNQFNVNYNENSVKNSNNNILKLGHSKDSLIKNNTFIVKNYASEDKPYNLDVINVYSNEYDNNLNTILAENNIEVNDVDNVNAITVSDEYNTGLTIASNNITIKSKSSKAINSANGLQDNNIIIKNNKINLTTSSDDVCGILINSGSEIIGNTIIINKSGYGINYIGSNNDAQIIKNNNITTSADYGIYLTSSSDSVITENLIYSKKPGNEGVYIGSGENNIVEDNQPEIIKENVTVNANVDDGYKYGDAVLFEVYLNNTAATGEITIIVSGKEKTATVENGKANITISDLTAGTHTAEIKYSGDSYYKNATNTVTFNIAKIDAPISYTVSNIKVGDDEQIALSTIRGVTGSVIVTVNNRTYNQTINKYGRISSVTLSNLPAATYFVNIFYAGDENYLEFNETTSFNVTEYEVPQWPNSGYDGQNTGLSPYVSDANGKILWNATVDGTINGNIAIDCDGNIYVASTSGVYSFDKDGNLRWTYTSWGSDMFSGIAISRDVIVSPRSGDTLYFIDQNTGAQYGWSNIYQASSIFPPIVDANSNLYVTSEYQYGGESKYNLVIVPFSSWKSGGEKYIIAIGDDVPTSSPVLINENLVGINTNNGFKIVDTTSQSVIGVININSNIKPVVGSGLIIYACDDTGILALTAENQLLWKVNVTGGLGNSIALSDNGYIYSVNSQGVLYKYDLNDEGKEYKVYDLKSTVSSNMLVDADGTVYLTTDNGVMYAFDANDNAAFLVLNSITSKGQPAIGENGVIYVYTNENTVYAIGKGDKQAAHVTYNVSDIYCGQDLIISVEIDKDATGNIAVEINGISYASTIDNGTALINITGMTSGSYTVNITYSGDRRFNTNTSEISFNVKKLNSPFDVNANKTIVVDEKLIIDITLPENATGNVSVTINGETHSEKVTGGKAVISISGLAINNYSVVVKYSGDDNYLENETEISFNVTKAEIDNIDDVLNVSTPSGSETVSYTINLPSDATGNLTVTVDGKDTYTKNLVNGSATINVADLSQGDHSIVVSYSGDAKYEGISKNTTFHVPVVKLSENKDISMLYTSGSPYSVLVTSDGKVVAGVKVTFKFNGKTYTSQTDAKGYATLKLPNVKPKNAKYTITATYKGVTVENKVKVNSIIKAKNKKVKKSKEVTKVKVSLKKVNNKYLKNKKIKINFRGKTFKVKTNKKGVATWKVKKSMLKKLKVGKKYKYKVTYGNTVTKKLTIKK